mmetsp:Transcript_23855/g.28824  ORF Transcript_23855/g.28824 Transcript_23855/m.28824 type:complete len:248 (-) Transcript_23855:105-848(-)|eukprot:CAMPEP_0197852472 /NCGR_PEP_ID=MMETSP1438-20131217/20668_1 /TAXON_ID=1461541 /ORGANISM="Pterosperma sp., Strain CCMP1384" /LENGTH=247 /DNA_ID=CAMNT_0043466545 /DNA_START=334 /DNA_END=1077 /DNA_ORIENTATION=+
MTMIPEPDGTACSLDKAVPDAKWDAQMKEWAAWKVTFDKDTGKFYCYDSDGNTETSPLGGYPEFGEICFMVILSSLGELKPTRGTLLLTPEKLHFCIEKGPGQVPDKHEDTLPMSEVAGWMMDGTGKLRIFMNTNKGIFEICIKSAIAQRIVQVLSIFTGWLYAANKTPEDQQAKEIKTQPENFMGQLPLDCNAIMPGIDAKLVEDHGKIFVHPVTSKILWAPVAAPRKIVTGIPEPEPEEEYELPP